MTMFRAYATVVMFATIIAAIGYPLDRIVINEDRRWWPVLIVVLVLAPAYLWWMTNILIGWKKS